MRWIMSGSFHKSVFKTYVDPSFLKRIWTMAVRLILYLLSEQTILSSGVIVIKRYRHLRTNEQTVSNV